MGKIKFFDKEVTAGFIGEGLEIAAKATDEFDLCQHDGLLSIIPFGRLANYLVAFWPDPFTCFFLFSGRHKTCPYISGR